MLKLPSISDALQGLKAIDARPDGSLMNRNNEIPSFGSGVLWEKISRHRFSCSV